MRRLLFAAALLIAPTAGRAADPVAYLPADTDAVLTFNARQVAESELGRKFGADLLKELLRASKPAADAVEATGLDPLKDFDLITVGMDLDKLDPPRPFALFEGKFDAKKVEASVQEFMKAHPEKLSAVTVGEKGAYKIAGRKPEEAMYAAVLDDTKLVVAATEKDLSGAFAAAAGTRRPAVSKELARLLATAKSTAPIFARAWVKGKFNDLKLPNDKLQAQVRAVEWATAAVTVTRDVSITLTLSAPDEAAAKTLSDLLGAVVGLVRLQMAAAAEDQPELRPVSDLLRATKVAPVGKTVVATGSVKGEAIEKALHPPEPTDPKPAPKPKAKPAAAPPKKR
jgi:hypothetical protein